MVPMSNLPPLPDDSPALIPAVVEPAEEEKPQRLSPGAIAGGIVGAVLLLALVFGVAYLAITSPDGTRTARDVAIIFLALMSIFVVAALVILIILISRLVIMLQVEIKPMLESLNETTRTLREPRRASIPSALPSPVRVPSSASSRSSSRSTPSAC